LCFAIWNFYYQLPPKRLNQLPQNTNNQPWLVTGTGRFHPGRMGTDPGKRNQRNQVCYSKRDVGATVKRGSHQ
jgi:hypothetical protein